MAGELRFGVIGTGMMGMEHLRHLLRMPGVRVTACADPDAGSRAQATALLPGVPILADGAALLARDDVDAVVIATPNFTHARVLDDVFAAGKHVLVEKPLCTTLADARAVADRAAAHPGVFWVGLEYRYSAPMQRLVAAVHGGEVGRLRTLSIREHRNPFLVKVGNWNRFSRNTGGTLVEKCCHFFDLMRFITRSEPTHVYASGAQDVNHLDERYDGEVPDILDNAFVTVDFADGSRAMLDLCMFAEAGMNHEDIVAIGDTGKAQCLLPQALVAIGERSTKAVRRERVPMDPALLELGGHYGATWGELERFCAAIRNGTAAEVTAQDGLLSVAMGVAAHRSIDERRVVAMAEVLNDGATAAPGARAGHEPR
jgi:predicted dehydrogenase